MFAQQGQEGWCEARLLPAGALKHLQELHAEIQSILTVTARNSFQAGRNLLLQLHAGSISPDEFNRRDGGNG